MSTTTRDRGRGRTRGRNNSNRFFQNQSDTRPKCQICQGRNHTAITCFQRYNHASPQAHTVSLMQPGASLASQTWFPDTGAMHHATPDLASLGRREDYVGGSQLVVGNGQGLPITHTGSSLLSTPSKPLYLNEILHVPDLTKSLLSVQ